MKKLMVLVLLASFTGAAIAQQTPSQSANQDKTTHADKDKKDKKKHHHHHHDHKPTDDKK